MSLTSHTERKAVGLAMVAFESLRFFFRELHVHDYGIDAQVELEEEGRPTGEIFGVQIKGGASYFSEIDEEQDAFVFRGDATHFDYWLAHCLPIVVLLCDIGTNRVYWQLITRQNVLSTGSGRKLLVPRRQLVDKNSLEKLKQLATNVVPTHRYSILKQSDTSWIGAKRYSLQILLNGTLTKAEIATVIRQVVSEYASSKYYRDSIVEQHWKESDAHAIFIFVYLTIEDKESANFLCRSLWLNPSLDQKNAPLPLKGESTGDNIITEWSARYGEIAKLRHQLALTKEDYLRKIHVILNELKPAMRRLILIFEQEDELGKAEKSTLLESALKSAAPGIDDLYRSSMHLGVAPIECAEADNKFQEVMASAHNLIFPFAGYGPNTSRSILQERMAIDGYKQEIVELEYELRKVR